MTQLDGIAAPHALPAAEVAERLGVDPTHGLESVDAESRLVAYGSNELELALVALVALGPAVVAEIVRSASGIVWVA